MTLFSYLAYAIVLFVAYIIFSKVIPSIQFKSYYQKQGVFFSPGWSFISDMKALTQATIDEPDGFPFYKACQKIYGKVLPPVWAMFLGPFRAIVFNAPEYLEDIYVKLNSMHSKHELEQEVFNLLIPTSIVFLPTEDKDYAERRKILASAFYKNNVAKMIELIKKVTVDMVRDLHTSGEKEVDIIQLTSILQQRIIINVSVGPGFSERFIDFEDEKGNVAKRPITQVIFDLIIDTCSRSEQFLFLIFPELTKYAITARDRRALRNIQILRREVRNIIVEKKALGCKENTLVDMLL